MHYFFNNKDHLGVSVSINSKSMAQDLVYLGLYKNKSLDLRPPFSEQVPRAWIKYWILGYFDGDGGLTIWDDKAYHRKRYKMSFLGTKEVIDYIQDFLFSTKTTTLAHNCKATYQINFTETDTLAILNYLYKDFDMSICLERKYQKYLEIIEIDKNQKTKRERKQTCLIPY